MGWVLLITASLASAQESATTKAAPSTLNHTAPVKASAAKTPYPINFCIVSGEELKSSSTVTKTYNGRDVEFCCNQCPKAFEKNPAKFLKKLDDAIIAKEKPGYPLVTSVVSGDTLGARGEPVDYIYQNRLVRLASASEVETFGKTPDIFLKKLDDAMAVHGKSAAH
jgi:YHS domain-containing protein